LTASATASAGSGRPLVGFVGFGFGGATGGLIVTVGAVVVAIIAVVFVAFRFGFSIGFGFAFGGGGEGLIVAVGAVVVAVDVGVVAVDVVRPNANTAVAFVSASTRMTQVSPLALAQASRQPTRTKPSTDDAVSVISAPAETATVQVVRHLT
jgi:hypothetical protein